MQIRLILLIGLMAFLVSFVTFAQPGQAQAALTLNNFSGFETNGLDEALATAGTPVGIGTPVHSGDFSIHFNSSADSYDIAMITGGSTDSDNDFIVGFFVRMDSWAGAGDIIVALDDAGGEVWSLRHSGGDLIAQDADISVIATCSSCLVIDTWHLIEVRWQHQASGDFDLHLDGVSEISETAEDLTDGGAISEDAAVYRLNGPTSNNRYFDDFYAYSGGTGTGDFLGDAEVFRYQANTNSAVADRNVVGSGPDNLEQGVWQDLGETPLSSDATEPGYTSGDARAGAMDTDDTQSGDNFRPGPSGDSNIDGDSNIKGGKWLNRLRRDNGSGTTHFFAFGDSIGNAANVTVTLGVTFTNFFLIRTDVSDVPSSSEFFTIGFRKLSGGREIFSEEMWTFILHVPDGGAPPPRRIFPVQ